LQNQIRGDIILTDFSAKLNKKMKNIYICLVLCCFFLSCDKKNKEEAAIDEIPWK
jgi:hypothetical protein